MKQKLFQKFGKNGVGEFDPENFRQIADEVGVVILFDSILEAQSNDR